jgi:hypothetical protein
MEQQETQFKTLNLRNSKLNRSLCAVISPSWSVAEIHLIHLEIKVKIATVWSDSGLDWQIPGIAV